MIRRSLPLAALLFLSPAVTAQTVTLTGGKHNATNVVVTIPGGESNSTVNGIPAQKATGGLVCVLPKLPAGETVSLNVKPSKPVERTEFTFRETPGEHVDVMYGERPVLRYVNKPRAADNHYLTFKPFHQLFEPKDGKTLLSSGAHPNVPEFKFPHHRGLFFGFNKISYATDGKPQQADIWHGTKNVFSTADTTTNSEAGLVFAKQSSNISWHGPDGKTFADETRTVIVYHVPGGTMLDWSTELSTKLDKVRLDGDPQHAGFHFRATQEVSKTTAKQTYYLRPDGKGKEGETRNWDSRGKDPRTVNLPWNAMSFVTGGKRYTALRINHPDNPKETRGSERDYGRFGDYFEWDLTPKTPLKLKYRVWLQEGEMTVEQCEAMAHGFTDAVTVKVTK